MTTSPDPSPATPCVLCFNASDPSGAGGLGADITALVSASCHALPVVTAVWVGDTRQRHQLLTLEADWIDEQARAVLEDVPVHAVKVSLAMGAQAVSAIGSILSDYDELPVVTYVPELAALDDAAREALLEAAAELLLPQTDVLVGNHHTLARWLLPEWEDDRPPGPRDIARAAATCGAGATLLTGVAQGERLDNLLATPEVVLASVAYERIDATFVGAGDTLAAALAGLLAHEAELPVAASQALAYLDQALLHGFQPGMGHAIPQRLFWADEAGDEADTPDDDTSER
ncbi:Hydroxymethylpyrimidine/phosphomethylpyrimidine kinase [Tepidimonas sediminis]|uniref:Hydroxymethylpyrimidine/phosphomethylpyrimidine kinase n=1 Tax=Tepidimonas sediminis TaxID=2588941 RepID=A0A554WIG5_9BURK|nr:bifunctional hydroxymethylpyrimidine kinase/phosphomethylpyrimidine kinase [Tepidimonas sediminis]TSE23363.1 Hydroxymethylpyrimidine/phosphomethylpyrimidine kinase [Tepidimonas sediminis]